MQPESINSQLKRKGRGFKQDHQNSLQTMKFDTLKDSQGKIMKSVEGWIIIVTNLHEEISEEDLIDLFSEFGPLKNIHLNLDRRTGFVKVSILIGLRFVGIFAIQ